MKREKLLLINTFVLSLGTVLPKAATFLILPILTTALTKSEYGTYDLIITSLSLVLPIFSLLIEQAVFRFLLDKNTDETRKKIITNSSIYVFFSSIFLFLISMAVLNRFNIEYKILVSIYMVINMYYSYVIQACRGLGLLKKYSTASIINSVLNLLLIFIFVGQKSLGFYGLLISLIISIVFATGYVIASSGIVKLISFKLFDLMYIKELLKYSFPLLPNSVSWWVVGVSDRWIITAFLSVEMTAIYAIANKIPSLFSLLYNNFNLAWQESATVTSKDNDAKEYYTNIFNNLWNFLVGILLLLITTSPVLFKLFIDESYFLAYYQMPILFLAMFFHSLAAYFGGMYVAFKKTKSIGLSSFIAAFLNISINLLLISKIGLYAASLSTLVSYFALSFYRAIDLQKSIQIKYSFAKIIFSISIVVFVAIISYLNVNILNALNFIIAVLVAIILNRNLLVGVLSKVRKKINQL